MQSGTKNYSSTFHLTLQSLLGEHNVRHEYSRQNCAHAFQLEVLTQKGLMRFLVLIRSNLTFKLFGSL